MTAIRRRAVATALAAAGSLAAAVVPAKVAAQSCGLIGGTGLAASAGFTTYDVGGGTSGPAYGVDGGLALAGASARVGYRRMDLESRGADLGRVAIAVPIPLPFDPGRVTLCGAGHAGAARMPLDDESTTVLAGGAGLRIAIGLPVGGGRAVPYGEVRGLAARSTGALFGIDVGASGMAVGLEGGIQAAFGSMTLRLAASVDGFDDGLGITPYPNTAAEIALGVRF